MGLFQCLRKLPGLLLFATHPPCSGYPLFWLLSPHVISFFLIIFVYLFMAVLGLCCCKGLFLVPASVELLSRCRAQPQELWHVGLVAPRHVRSSGVRDQTRVFFIGRQILYRWDTREAPTFAVLELHKSGIIYLCSSVSGFFHLALICVAVMYSFTDA